MKKLKPKQKKILLATIAVVVVVAIGLGIFFGTRGGGDPVGVYNFNMVGMTEYWGDMLSTYGPVTTDRIQTVFLSDTQTVTEVKVAQGDTVKKGDVLLSYDTTLSDLQLERQRLKVEKFKLEQEEAEKRLDEIKRMKPMQVPSFDFGTDFEEDSSDGIGLGEAFRVSDQHNYDGSAPEKALICWLKGTTAIDDNVLETIRLRSEQLQKDNLSDPPDEWDPYPEYPDDGSWEEEWEDEGWEEEWEDDNWEEEFLSTQGDYRVFFLNNEEGGEAAPVEEPPAEEPPAEDWDDYPEDDWNEDPGFGQVYVTDFYVVFKITQGDMSLGARRVWQGAHVFCTESGFAMQLFDANGIPDYTLATQEQEPDDAPDIDYGSGMTAAQIKELRLEQEKKIKDLALNQKMAEAEYKIMQAELGDGNIYADIDGEVVSLMDAEESKNSKQPVVKVSGGGGFYVRGTVSELEKDNLKIGQEVRINDYRSGMTYTGTVKEIGDFPATSYSWSSMFNPNATNYPFTAFVDGDADLQEGNYVDIEFSTSTTTNGIYLQNPFIRTEDGVSYVLVRGEDGKLEKREITLGKSLWGSYSEVRSGNITTDDYIAFPYGKHVKPGVPTVEGDISDLYSY